VVGELATLLYSLLVTYTYKLPVVQISEFTVALSACVRTTHERVNERFAIDPHRQSKKPLYE
jgi:hypothetical protein